MGANIWPIEFLRNDKRFLKIFVDSSKTYGIRSLSEGHGASASHFESHRNLTTATRRLVATHRGISPSHASIMKFQSPISRLAARHLTLRPIAGLRRASSGRGTVGARANQHLPGAMLTTFMPGLCAEQLRSFERVIAKQYRDPWCCDLPVVTRVVGAKEGAGT